MAEDSAAKRLPDGEALAKTRTTVVLAVVPWIAAPLHLAVFDWLDRNAAGREVSALLLFGWLAILAVAFIAWRKARKLPSFGIDDEVQALCRARKRLARFTAGLAFLGMLALLVIGSWAMVLAEGLR